MHFAYIDPGSGSLFIQALIGAAVAGGFIFRNAVAKLISNAVRLIKKSKRQK